LGIECILQLVCLLLLVVSFNRSLLLFVPCLRNLKHYNLINPVCTWMITSLAVGHDLLWSILLGCLPVSAICWYHDRTRRICNSTSRRREYNTVLLCILESSISTIKSGIGKAWKSRYFCCHFRTLLAKRTFAPTDFFHRTSSRCSIDGKTSEWECILVTGKAFTILPGGWCVGNIYVAG